MFLGLRSHILAVEDLASARDWYTGVLGKPPYFDEPFYVGFEVGGFELGLLPGRTADYPAGGLTYWGVESIEEAWDRLVEAGAGPSREITDVGDGIKLGVLLDAAGNSIGIIENPHFRGS